MKLVRKCMNIINDEAHKSEKATLANEVRLILFNYNYPFPHICKKVSWCLLILICMACFLFSVLYGLQFDLNAANMDILEENMFVVDSAIHEIENDNGECWNISQKLVIQKGVMGEQIVQIQNEQHDIQQVEEPYSTDFEGEYQDSTKWLLNVLISFLQSVFCMVHAVFHRICIVLLFIL